MEGEWRGDGRGVGGKVELALMYEILQKNFLVKNKGLNSNVALLLEWKVLTEQVFQRRNPWVDKQEAEREALKDLRTEQMDRCSCFPERREK